MRKRQEQRPTVVAVRLAVPMTALLCLAGAGLPGSAFGEAPAPAAAQTLAELIARAAGNSVASRFERQQLEATRSAFEVAATAGPSSLGLQSEGLGSSFDREANALDTLRYVRPTAAPWHSGARRDFHSSLSDWHAQETAATPVVVGAEVARLWLEWAAAEAESSLRQLRLDRVVRALTLFEARYRLGEVAGTEVRQLEAQQADDRIALTEIQLQVSQKRGALFALLGFEPSAPTIGSLSELSQWLNGIETPEIDLADEPGLQAERIQARADLALDLATLEEKTAAGQPSFMVELERIPSLDNRSSVEAFGVQVSLPLPFGRSVAKRRAAARAKGTLAEADAEFAQSRLSRDLDLWHRQSSALASELSQLDPMVEGMAETEHSLNEQFRLGAISYLVFLDGVARLDDVRLRHVQLQRLHVKSRIELGQLTGDSRYFPLLPRVPSSTDTEGE